LKKIYLYIIGIVALIAVGIYFGWEFAGLLGAGGAFAEFERNKKKTKDAKKKAEKDEQSYNDLKKDNDQKIKEAGDDIEADNFNDPDNAADYIDDVLDDNSK